MSDDREPWKVALGVRAKALRAQSTLTLKALAARSGLSVRFLSQVEAGQANPSLGSLRDLAEGLDCDLVALLFDLPSPTHSELLTKLPLLSVAACTRALAEAPQTIRPVALLGLRGAGKSTVGEALASVSTRPFVEVDRVIEGEAGLGLGALFEMHGEAHYRTLEQRVLERELKDPAVILATGGGVVTHPESVALLKERATTVWLKAPAQAHWDRVRAQGDFRPMNNRARARTELEALYTARAPLYAAADHVVETEGRSIAEVVAHLCAVLRVGGPEARQEKANEEDSPGHLFAASSPSVPRDRGDGSPSDPPLKRPGPEPIP